MVFSIVPYSKICLLLHNSSFWSLNSILHQVQKSIIMYKVIVLFFKFKQIEQRFWKKKSKFFMKCKSFVTRMKYLNLIKNWNQMYHFPQHWWENMKWALYFTSCFYNLSYVGTSLHSLLREIFFFLLLLVVWFYFMDVTNYLYKYIYLSFPYSSILLCSLHKLQRKVIYSQS